MKVENSMVMFIHYSIQTVSMYTLGETGTVVLILGTAQTLVSEERGNYHR